jgi:hypothetical protein
MNYVQQLSEIIYQETYHTLIPGEILKYISLILSFVRSFWSIFYKGKSYREDCNGAVKEARLPFSDRPSEIHYKDGNVVTP